MCRADFCRFEAFLSLHTKLTVYARYTRRGGLDINPYRSDFEQPGESHRPQAVINVRSSIRLRTKV